MSPEEKSSGRWIGRIGLNLLADWPGPDKWEVGYELIRSFWGRGLATEGARRTIRFAWEQTPLNRIISVTVPHHLASRRVMQKSGLAFQAEIAWRATSEDQEAFLGVRERPRQPRRPSRVRRFGISAQQGRVRLCS